MSLTQLSVVCRQAVTDVLATSASIEFWRDMETARDRIAALSWLTA